MNSININIYEIIQNNVPNDLASLPQWVAVRNDRQQREDR